MEGEEVDRVLSPPILKRVREEEQRDSPLWVTGEWGSHTEGRVKGTGPAVKPPPGTRSPEGEGGEKGAGRNPEVHPGPGMSIPQVARLEDRPSCGVGSSNGESAEEGEGTLKGPPVVGESTGFHLGYGSPGEESSAEGERTPVDTDTEVSMGGEPVQGQEGTSIGGQSPDNEWGSPRGTRPGGQVQDGRVSGQILRTKAQGTPDERLGLVAGECGVKYGKERGRGSWHGYISPREKCGQGKCRIGSRGEG